MNIEVNRWEGAEWSTVPQNDDKWRAFVKTVMNHQIPWSSGNFFSSWKNSYLLERNVLHEAG